MSRKPETHPLVTPTFIEEELGMPISSSSDLGADGIRISSRILSVEHVTVETATPYATVKARFEGGLTRLDDSYRSLMRESRFAELAERLAQGAEPFGLMLHYVAPHGDWLGLEGERREGTACFIGNVASAAKMTKVNFGTALYAPLRIVLYEQDSGTRIEYDKPSSQFCQFKECAIDEVASSLDQRIAALVQMICELT